MKKFLVMAEATEDELPDLYKDEIESKSSKKSPTSGTLICKLIFREEEEEEEEEKSH